jgi:tartrate dehydrogenase/decarboxylase/D-malate dehydrogenase
MSTHRIAVIPGDGIGTEVVPAGLEALGATADRFGLNLAFDHFDFASVGYWQRHGRMLPLDWEDTLRGYDALYFGAVGWPSVVPDHVSLWGSLLQFRRVFDQYVNLRPAGWCPVCAVRWLTGLPATSTSSSCGRTPRGSTPAWAGVFSRAPIAKPCCRKR